MRVIVLTVALASLIPAVIARADDLAEAESVIAMHNAIARYCAASPGGRS